MSMQIQMEIIKNNQYVDSNESEEEDGNTVLLPNGNRRGQVAK
jgi:hypothetical protein